MTNSIDVTLACEVAVLRALVVSGKTIRNRYRSRAQRGAYQDVPEGKLYMELAPGPTDAELARLATMDRWSALLTVLAPTIGVDSAGRVIVACNDYVSDLLRTQQPHERQMLMRYIAGASRDAAAQ